MKKYIFLVLLAITTAACGSQQANTNMPASNTAANTAANSAAPAEKRLPAVGPLETLKAISTASKAGDMAGVMKHLSQGTVAEVEKAAAENKVSTEEYLKSDPPFVKLPETRNEEITGDRATVELYNEISKSWEKMPFVIENGEWKLAMDEYVKDFERQLEEEEKGSEANQANTSIEDR